MNQQDNSWLRWTVLSAIFVALFAAVLSSAQSAAPPTARQAAADPAFASRLHPPAGGAHLSRSPHRRMPASPQDQTLYDNGPYNGTTDAWSINSGFSVSDSFTVPTNSSITGNSFRVLGCVDHRSSHIGGHGSGLHLVWRNLPDADRGHEHVPRNQPVRIRALSGRLHVQGRPRVRFGVCHSSECLYDFGLFGH